MDETTETSILSQPNACQWLIDALTSDCIQQGWTFSVYRSRKQRTWVCYKTFEPVMVNTSVEVDASAGDTALAQAMLLAHHSHAYKIETGDVFTDKWIPAPHSPERVKATITWLLEQLERVSDHYRDGSG